MLTTLTPRLRMDGAILLLPLYAFIAKQGQFYLLTPLHVMKF